ncbi:MAG: hypothetical protein AAFZ07_01925 [Actinomycetota bacterium]
MGWTQALQIVLVGLLSCSCSVTVDERTSESAVVETAARELSQLLAETDSALTIDADELELRCPDGSDTQDADARLSCTVLYGDTQIDVDIVRGDGDERQLEIKGIIVALDVLDRDLASLVRPPLADAGLAAPTGADDLHERLESHCPSTGIVQLFVGEDLRCPLRLDGHAIGSLAIIVPDEEAPSGLPLFLPDAGLVESIAMDGLDGLMSATGTEVEVGSVAVSCPPWDEIAPSASVECTVDVLGESWRWEVVLTDDLSRSSEGRFTVRNVDALYFRDVLETALAATVDDATTPRCPAGDVIVVPRDELFFCEAERDGEIVGVFEVNLWSPSGPGSTYVPLTKR